MTLWTQCLRKPGWGWREMKRRVWWKVGEVRAMRYALWSKTGKNTDKLAIQSFTVPRVREWAKWTSEQTSDRSGAREQSEQGGASKRVSGASKRANRRVSGPVLTSGFLFVPDHSAACSHTTVLTKLITVLTKLLFHMFETWNMNETRGLLVQQGRLKVIFSVYPFE